MDLEKLRAELEDVKKRLGKPLYVWVCDDTPYVYTYLSYQQAKELEAWMTDNKNPSLSAVDEKIVSMGLVHPVIQPVEWFTLKAGIVSTLSSLIQQVSLLNLSPGDIQVEELIGHTPMPDPTETELAKVKESASHPLQLVRLGAYWAIIRPLLRSELNALQRQEQTIPGFDYPKELVKLCLVAPKSLNLEALPAGISVALMDQIMSFSGFGLVPQVIEL